MDTRRSEKQSRAANSSHEVRNAFIVALLTFLFVILFILLPRYFFIIRQNHYLDQVDEWLNKIECELDEEEKEKNKANSLD